MDEKLITIINEWNPMDIHPLIVDEYAYEIKRIQGIFNRNLHNAYDLGEIIKRVFIDSFGERFPKSLEECIKVAKKYFL
ncbi:DUF1871 family protein [Pelosinus sp. UFO1]|uniref:DUF1871 family protein n=1 Tax=Pelosinus sp. UFO1 TaxID=484770 RepID=UPI0004D1B6DD|nr:DUF1871 family protein [Pelosinus sp. UFO1]AIF51840.1 protein of unknown function DUF1871 [Pelosinus sp. UFO1]